MIFMIHMIFKVETLTGTLGSILVAVFCASIGFSLASYAYMIADWWIGCCTSPATSKTFTFISWSIELYMLMYTTMSHAGTQ